MDPDSHCKGQIVSRAYRWVCFGLFELIIPDQKHQYSVRSCPFCNPTYKGSTLNVAQPQLRWFKRLQGLSCLFAASQVYVRVWTELWGYYQTPLWAASREVCEALKAKQVRLNWAANFERLKRQLEKRLFVHFPLFLCIWTIRNYHPMLRYWILSVWKLAIRKKISWLSCDISYWL